MAYNDSAASPFSLTLTFGDSSIVIGDSGTPFCLLSSGIEGTEAPEAMPVCADYAQLDGSYLVSNRIPGREIVLLFEIAQHADREALRLALMSFFDPKAFGTLTVRRGNHVRSIGCVLGGQVTMTQPTLYDYIRVRVPLFCADPFFYAAEDKSVLAREAEGLLSFPLTVTADTGITAGAIAVGDTLTVENNGDTATGFLLTLTAYPLENDGACEIIHPVITREEDGAYIRILTTLMSGDVLSISTLNGNKYIKKNGEVCLLFDCDSTFFPLNKGTNTLKVSAEQMTGMMESQLSYRMKYYGA